MSDLSHQARVAESFVEVRSYELDSFGHANHAVFLNYLEYARFDALRQGGFPYEELVARGWGVYVVRIEVDYLKEARLNERLRIRTWVDGYKRTSMVLAQEISPAADPSSVLARARVTAVWVGADRKPMRVPAEVHVALGLAVPGSDPG
ncbi:MAG: acyl-CoA thioesterase [Gemmatimonadetes bacterium]|nr:acyl-CoA thioesterase [Gemmatimonadota bacterium]